MDTLCHRLCLFGNAERLKQPLIAFGDASTTSTGFGYAPAPMARLRHRLQRVHEAAVTLIHEFRTSMMCHECHAVLEKCFHRGVDRKKARPIHGIMSCTACRTPSGTKQFLHRDVNAAENMMAVYLSLATAGARPEYLRRGEE